MSRNTCGQCLSRAALLLVLLLVIVLGAAFIAARGYHLGTITVSSAPNSAPQTFHSFSTSGTTSTASTSSIAQAVFNAINQSRASSGLSALKWDDALVRSAHQHNLAMTAANQLSHQVPGEAELGTREKQQGVSWVWAAENIGETTDMSQQGALSLHQAMMAEKPPDDGHRQNILTTTGTEVGVDIVLDTQHHLLWLTEDFAAE